MLYVDTVTPPLPKDPASNVCLLVCERVCSWNVLLHLSPVSPGVASHLFVETLQLHLQRLQEALPLGQLTLSSSQSLVALFHLILYRLQLDMV